jgi:FAD/FMN-containing dehydrogenase
VTGVLSDLRAIVGERHVLVDADLRAGYEVDWSGRFRGTTPAVVRPGSVEEVAAVVAYCRASGIPIVAQGGNTGLVGGSVPVDGELVLSLRRLDGLGPVDDLAGQVTVGAGTTLAAAQRHVEAAGWSLGIDLAARDSATIGGMVATNAGGLAFVRHGGMRQRVLGVEAVLGDGSAVSHLGGLLKDNTGYDLAALLCGSEGTLGVVTAVRLRLVAPDRDRVTALAAVGGVDEALATVAALRRAGAIVDAAELFLDDGLALVCRHLDLPRPMAPAPTYVLVDWEGPLDALTEAPVLDAVVAEDMTRRAALWRYREAHTETVNALGVPHKLDVTLPLPALERFLVEVREVVERTAPGSVVVLFGHVADGNVHVNVIGPGPDDEGVDEAVLQLVVERGGSISAEHGIGRAKLRWLHLVRSAEELAAFRAIKGALDPAGILNPHVLIPGGTTPPGRPAPV